MLLISGMTAESRNSLRSAAVAKFPPAQTVESCEASSPGIIYAGKEVIPI